MEVARRDSDDWQRRAPPAGGDDPYPAILFPSLFPAVKRAVLSGLLQGRELRDLYLTGNARSTARTARPQSGLGKNSTKPLPVVLTLS